VVELFDGLDGVDDRNTGATGAVEIMPHSLYQLPLKK
jgi:hypothetical protein